LARGLDTVTRVTSETQSESRVEASRTRATPGALLVFTVDRAQFARIDLVPGSPVTWQRNDVSGLRIADSRLSREGHLTIRWADGAFELHDLDSTNGSYLNGERFYGRRAAKEGDVLRIGRTLFVLVNDVSEYRGYVETSTTDTGKPLVIGPRVRTVLDRAASARQRSRNLVILGENGTGKEQVAVHYHRSAKKPGPLVTVNSATVPAATADAQLFGARKGVYTDVKERMGLVASADGGVLFFDELAEMEKQTQEKLLRVIENGEFNWGGEATVTKVQVSFVTASHQPLRNRVKDGRFREDLFYRLNQEEVLLPPLRDRREEIPWLMALEMQDTALHCSAVEMALLRPWPGNLRELRSATNAAVTRAFERHAEAVQRAREAGEAPPEGPPSVRDVDFREDAGQPLAAEPPECPPLPPPRLASARPAGEPAGKREPAAAKYSKDDLVAALTRNGWNKKRTAKELQLNRTQLYREIDKHGIQPPPGAEERPGATLAEDEENDSDDSGPAAE
jgi:DNA-binding NtrC family response regulator